MIATVHDNRGALPGNRVELYAEICEVLLTRRIEAKGMTDSIKLNLTQKKAVLQVLALELMKGGIREFSLAQGKEIIKSSLAAVAKTEIKPEDFFENIEKISGLLTKKDESFYIFAHLSFQEYLASVQIQESNQEDLLIQNINNNWWTETIRLYAAKNDISNLILAAINNPNITSISLAMDCLEEGKSCSPEVRQMFNQLWIKGWKQR
jgi:predicted NACHT family NTPase